MLLAFLSQALCAVFHKLGSNGEPDFRNFSRSLELVVQYALLCSRACLRTAECDIMAFNTANNTCIIGSNTTEITFTPSAEETAWRVYEIQCMAPVGTCQVGVRGNGAHLLVVNDKAENDFIYNVLFGDYRTFHILTGGFRLLEESTYKWITGEPWTFANWNPVEPSFEDRGKEDCMCITGQWNWTDIPCNQTRMFVCEF